jgi:hypothetical protein
MKLITNLCILSRLRMSGGVLLLSQYAFMAWTGMALPLSATCYCSCTVPRMPVLVKC